MEWGILSFDPGLDRSPEIGNTPAALSHRLVRSYPFVEESSNRANNQKGIFKLGQITLTTKLGHFTFDSHVVLSKAKLIRDSVTGQYFNPKSDEPKIKTVDDAFDFVGHHIAGDLKYIPFEVVFHI